jgi:hypothetical protein
MVTKISFADTVAFKAQWLLHVQPGLTPKPLHFALNVFMCFV